MTSRHEKQQRRSRRRSKRRPPTREQRWWNERLFGRVTIADVVGPLVIFQLLVVISHYTGLSPLAPSISDAKA